MGLIDPISGVTLTTGVTQPDSTSLGSATAVAPAVGGTAAGGSVMYPGATPGYQPSPNPEVTAHLSSPQGSMLYADGIQAPNAPGYQETAPAAPAPVQGVQFQQPQGQQQYGGPDPWQLAMDNYALQTAVSQYEGYFQQYGEIDRILRSDPTKMQRVMDVIRGGGSPEQVQAVAAETAVAPTSPEAAAAGAPPPFTSTREYQALQREIQSLRQETQQSRHQSEVLKYRMQMDDMQGRYGPAFNRQAVAAHAMRIGTDDLEQAFAHLIGSTVLSEASQRRQQQRTVGPNFPQPQAPQQYQQQAPLPNNVIQHPAMVAQQAPAPVAPPGVRVEPPGARYGAGPSAPPPQQPAGNWTQVTNRVAAGLRAGFGGA